MKRSISYKVDVCEDVDSCGEIVTEETCTQNLHKFNQAKHYKGSPLKSEDLPLANTNLNVIFVPREQEY